MTWWGFHGPRVAMPRFVFRPLCCRIATPQRLTGPWKPLPVVTAATSMCWPSLNISSGVAVLPSNCFAYSIVAGWFLRLISISVMSGFFFDKLVCLGWVAAIARIMAVWSRLTLDFLQHLLGVKVFWENQHSVEFCWRVFHPCFSEVLKAVRGFCVSA